ncbi:MAG: tetrapyrrole methylase family protein / MazG family protein [Acidimicrobiaceae bacterium]
MGGRVVVVGLGPGGPDLMTGATLSAIERVPVRFLRTGRHPAARAVVDAETFDHVYDAAETLDGVYETIVDALVAAADVNGEVLYAVPGSPAVAERTVVLLRERAAAGDVEVEVLAALSFVDLTWTRLAVDPIAAGVRIVDGHRFAVEAAGERGPLLVAQCDSPAVLSEIKLAIDLDGPPVTVLQRLGLPDESITMVKRADLDRGAVAADHLTSLYFDEHVPAVASEVARFDELVHVLRERCPWDRSQTHRSLTRHLLEETYEVLDALEAVDEDEGTGYEHLEEELGDLLFQIVFHTTLAGEAGAFTLDDVARGIHDKLVRRHPHVFGGVAVPWEELKRAEKGRASVFDGIPAQLPALLYAFKVLGKAASLDADLPAAVTVDDPAGIGAALLAVVAAARALDVDPEAALRAAADELKARAQSRET